MALQLSIFDILNEPKPLHLVTPAIKKGYGIPYKGSKRGIALQLFNKMLEYKPNAKYFYDLFGGGGAMSAVALQAGLKVYYNELNTQICELIKFLRDTDKIPDEWYKWVDRDTFNRYKNEPTAYSGFISCCYSFGNNGRNYLFSKDIENIKHFAHQVVVFKDKTALKELNKILNANIVISDIEDLHTRRINFYKQVREQKGLRADLQQLERLEQLERLQQLQQLQQLERLERLEVSNSSYNDVLITTPVKETIIYLDPPYRNTDGYNVGDFDSNKLDEWFKNTPYTCFMSEYNAPHKSIYEIEKRCTLSVSNNSLKKSEKLYYNGK